LKQWKGETDMRRLRLLYLLALFALPLGFTSVQGSVAGRTGALAATFTPTLTLVPSEDGTSLYIDAGGVRPFGDTLFVNLGIGPGHNKGSWTMSFSETVDLYVTTAAGFTPGINTSSELHITTTLGLATAPVEFSRAFVHHDTPTQITSPNGALALSLITAGTLPADTYIAIVPSYAAPAPPPPGYQMVGETYSVRAPGSLPTADLPMSLRMTVSPQLLGALDPQTLVIAVWNGQPGKNGSWEILGGELLTDLASRAVAATTRRFGTFALMSGPAWSDSFADLEGLDLPTSSGVTLGLVNDELALVPEPEADGVAVSRLINASPTTWGTLSYSAIVPPESQLAVDLLSADGSLLLEDVTSGTSLASIDGQVHPNVRLRVRLTAGPLGERPALLGWGITWQSAESRRQLFLPLIVR
jgi:hypothetical protein